MLLSYDLIIGITLPFLIILPMIGWRLCAGIRRGTQIHCQQCYSPKDDITSRCPCGAAFTRSIKGKPHSYPWIQAIAILCMLLCLTLCSLCLWQVHTKVPIERHLANNHLWQRANDKDAKTRRLAVQELVRRAELDTIEHNNFIQQAIEIQGQDKSFFDLLIDEYLKECADKGTLDQKHLLQYLTQSAKPKLHVRKHINQYGPLPVVITAKKTRSQMHRLDQAQFTPTKNPISVAHIYNDQDQKLHVCILPSLKTGQQYNLSIPQLPLGTYTLRTSCMLRLKPDLPPTGPWDIQANFEVHDLKKITARPSRNTYAVEHLSKQLNELSLSLQPLTKNSCALVATRTIKTDHPCALSVYLQHDSLKGHGYLIQHHWKVDPSSEQMSLALTLPVSLETAKAKLKSPVTLFLRSNPILLDRCLQRASYFLPINTVLQLPLVESSTHYPLDNQIPKSKETIASSVMYYPAPLYKNTQHAVRTLATILGLFTLLLACQSIITHKRTKANHNQHPNYQAPKNYKPQAVWFWALTTFLSSTTLYILIAII